MTYRKTYSIHSWLLWGFAAFTVLKTGYISP